jgi:hypothetical protein
MPECTTRGQFSADGNRTSQAEARESLNPLNFRVAPIQEQSATLGSLLRNTDAVSCGLPSIRQFVWRSEQSNLAQVCRR